MDILLLAAVLLLQRDGWSELPIPAIARPSPSAQGPRAGRSASHIELEPARPQAFGSASAFHLPLPNLIELVEADARSAGHALRFLRTAPPLLARGSEQALERARATLADLDRAGRRQRLRLHLRLASAGGESPLERTFDLCSGETATLGTEESRAFLAGFEVDVASGGGTADPTVGLITTGPTVEVSAWRTPLGGDVFVAGILDLSELLSLELVDTGSPDLGRIEHPHVRSAEIRFSGLVANGERLSVAVRGAPLARADWDLAIEVETEPDAVGAWRIVDLAWLENELPESSLPQPGAGLALRPEGVPERGGPEPLPAAVLWGELEASLSARSADRPVFAFVPGIVAAPTSEERVWGELDRLLEASTRARSSTRTVRVQRDSFSASFPTAEGVPFRVLVGEERTELVDYHTELAPEFWMASPEVARVFDGLLVQGRMQRNEVSATWWRSTSEASRALTRGETLHGRLDLVHRTLTSGTLRFGGEAQSGATAPGTPFQVEFESGKE